MNDVLTELRYTQGLPKMDNPELRIAALNSAAVWLSTPNSVATPDEVVSAARVFADYLRNG